MRQKLVHGSSTPHSAMASHFIRGKPYVLRVTYKSLCDLGPYIASLTSSPLLPALLTLFSVTLASSLLFITTTTFGAFAVVLFAWNILSPEYPHVLSFTFFMSQLTCSLLRESSLIALYKEQHSTSTTARYRPLILPYLSP